MPLTLAGIRTEVHTTLGGSGVDVELTNDDIDNCVKRAVREFNHTRPRHTLAALAVTPSQQRYVISHPGLHGVGIVTFYDASRIPSIPPDPLSMTAYNPLNQPGTSAAEQEMLLGYLKNLRQVMGLDTKWTAQWEIVGDPPVREYALYISAPMSGTLCSYDYSWHVTPDDHAVTGLRHLDAADDALFMDMVTAFASKIMVQIRGKYGGILNPDGGADALDTSEARQDAADELARVRDKLDKRRRPLPPLVG